LRLKRATDADAAGAHFRAEEDVLLPAFAAHSSEGLPPADLERLAADLERAEA
jgi:hypothetical protein